MKDTKIEWATHTFNPWEGCQKVGPGCDNCYAENRNARFAGGTAINWGPGAPRRRTSPKNWKKPLTWNANHQAFFAEHGHRQRVFCASLADVFDNAVPVEWRMDLFKLIAETPHLDWLILTKRIGNVMPMCSGDSLMFDLICERVWLGATIVNQEEADRDITKLMAVPAHKRFLSMEPLLGPVSLRWLAAWPENAPRTASNLSGGTNHLDGLRRIDWVIVGGESGPDARPMHPDWARSLRDQCQAAEVPFLFKQWGEWAPHQTIPGGDEGGDIRRGHVRYLQGDGREPDGHFRKGDAAVARVGKKAAGRLLDGITHDGVPL